MQLGDTRKLSQDTQEALRKRAIKLVVVDQKSVREAARAVGGVFRNSVYRWLAAYRVNGEVGLTKKLRGRRLGDQPKLSALQCKFIQRFITDKSPEQLKMPFALWTRQSVQHLIEHCFGINLAESTVGAYLRAHGVIQPKNL